MTQLICVIWEGIDQALVRIGSRPGGFAGEEMVLQNDQVCCTSWHMFVATCWLMLQAYVFRMKLVE